MCPAKKTNPIYIYAIPLYRLLYRGMGYNKGKKKSKGILTGPAQEKEGE